MGCAYVEAQQSSHTHTHYHLRRYTDLLSAYEEVVIEALKVLGPVVQCDWITQRRLCPCSHQANSTVLLQAVAAAHQVHSLASKQQQTAEV